ncbi:MAG: O-antigen ligase family protein [Nitrospira sp.]|nr:O-antigen ligase family protein [Nitrospira sp.]
MTSALLYLFFFARPIMFIDSSFTLGELNMFELLTIAFTLLLAGVAAVNAFGSVTIPFSKLDGAILSFVLWCSSVAMVYPETFDLKSYIKLILPPLTFFILKRAVASRKQYVSLLKWMIVGFVIPVLGSALMIYEGKGIGQRIFWTGLERYSGVYKDLHTMGHNMGFLVMLVCIYFAIMKDDARHRIVGLSRLSLLLLCALAFYCLGHGHVRTVYVGLLLFFSTFVLLYSKKGFVICGTIGIAVAVAALPFLNSVFFDVTEVFSGHRGVEEAGSGRPMIWNHNLGIYSELPIDRQLAGVGIGNFMANPFSDIHASSKLTMNHVWNSHNDFLEMLIEIGAIGLLLTAILYVRIGSAIFRMRGIERSAFLAFFTAVVAMNFLSNSYIARFGLAQMFFMVLVYVERPGLHNEMAIHSHDLPQQLVNRESVIRGTSNQ